MKRKALSVALAFLLILGLWPGVAPGAAVAAEPVHIVVGHTGGVVTEEDVWAAAEAAGLGRVVLTSCGKRFHWNDFYGSPSPFSVTFAPGITSIAPFVFVGTNALTSVTIPNSVTTIGFRAFSGASSLTSLTIPNSVTTIVELAFSGASSLTSLTIPNSVTTIGIRAFERASSLTSLTIPNSVTAIGYRAFADASSLTSITFRSMRPPLFWGNVFDGVPDTAKVYVPAGSRAAYRAVPQLGRFTIVEPPRVPNLTARQVRRASGARGRATRTINRRGRTNLRVTLPAPGANARYEFQWRRGTRRNRITANMARVARTGNQNINLRTPANRATRTQFYRLRVRRVCTRAGANRRTASAWRNSPIFTVRVR